MVGIREDAGRWFQLSTLLGYFCTIIAIIHLNEERRLLIMFFDGAKIKIRLKMGLDWFTLRKMNFGSTLTAKYCLLQSSSSA